MAKLGSNKGMHHLGRVKGLAQFSTWRRRWFVLSEAAGTLTYYADAHDASSIGVAGSGRRAVWLGQRVEPARRRRDCHLARKLDPITAGGRDSLAAD